jgi:hypothetical protein
MSLIDNESNNGSAKEAVLNEGFQIVVSQTMFARLFPMPFTATGKMKEQIGNEHIT